jgi:Ala-tRNA(Pro) deacylase
MSRSAAVEVGSNRRRNAGDLLPSRVASFPATAKEIVMPVEKLKRFLDDNKIKYVVIQHSLAYTAQQIAASAHIPGKDLAKTVMIKADGRMAMIVLPASVKVDLDQVKSSIQAESVAFASERDFKDAFPGCELGAMPPFGNLYGMDVFVNELLAKDTEIAFNAGSHTELIRMAYEDYQRLVNPKIIPS